MIFVYNEITHHLQNICEEDYLSKLSTKLQ